MTKKTWGLPDYITPPKPHHNKDRTGVDPGSKDVTIPLTTGRKKDD